MTRAAGLKRFGAQRREFVGPGGPVVGIVTLTRHALRARPEVAVSCGNGQEVSLREVVVHTSS